MISYYLRNLKNTNEELMILRSIWEKEKNNLKLSADILKNLENIEKLFFNSLSKKSSLLINIQKLPTMNDFSILTASTIKILENNGLLIIFENDQKFLCLTLEGIIISYLAIKYNNFINENVEEEIQSYENLLYQKYRNNSILKLINIKKNLLNRKKLLGKNQLSITLFLYINGSIGHNKAFNVKSPEIRLIADTIIRSFIQDDINNVKKDVYPFNWYLTTAKNIMGDVICNKYPNYYLYENKIDIIKNYIINSPKKIKNFKLKWNNFLNEYNKQRPILSRYNLSYYSLSNVLDLENKFKKEGIL
jgi:hypothetical protein